MSRRVTAFSSILPHPQMPFQFMVILLDKFDTKNLINLDTAKSIAVSNLIFSADFPNPVWDEDVIFAGGQKLTLPTKKQVEGTWNCSLYEPITMVGVDFIQRKFGIKANIVNKLLPKTMIGDDKPQFMDIIVALTSNIGGGEIPKNVRVLQHAWLHSAKPTKLDSASVNDVLKWDLVFKYSDIKCIQI